MDRVRPHARPLLGVLLLLVSVLVTLSALSSPPWPEATPYLGLPADACGLVGRFTAAFFLGFLGAPLTLAFAFMGFALSARWIVRRPEVSGVLLAWLLCTAMAASLFAATVGGGVAWGHFAQRVSGGLAASGLLGPVGAALVTGGLLLAFLVFGLPRWIPWRRTRALRPIIETLLTAAAVPVGLVRDALGDAGTRLRDWSVIRHEARAAARLAHEEERAERLRAATARLATSAPSKGPLEAERASAPIRFSGSETSAAPRLARVTPGTEAPAGGAAGGSRTGSLPRFPAEGVSAEEGSLPDAEPSLARRLWSRLIPWSRRRPAEDELAGALAAGGHDPRAAASGQNGSSFPGRGATRASLRGGSAPVDAHGDGEADFDEVADAGLDPHSGNTWDDEADALEDDLAEGAHPAGHPPGATAGQIAPILTGAPANDLTADGLDARTLGPDARGTNGARRRPAGRGQKKGIYSLPPLELLEEKPPQVGTVDRDEVVEKSKLLLRTLADFGIQGRIGQVHPGPVITQYEYEPAAGVRISQIVSRADDIALALRASRIRIVAPIPGKAAVGIEVPNRRAELISFREILDETDFGTVTGRLPLFLGRDIRGRPQHAFLEKMPHMLVAGTTGSGKSVCLNTCIFSLLYRNTPEDLRVLMIDPKMLELTVYDGIPHLLCPVVTDARMAAKMLNWMVGEMERRYRKMAAYGVRNIEGFKEKMRLGKVGEDALEPMPYIVVIVDELADLMLTLANEIETPIARLAQMARAVGIHLILATQRPSVDVITGVIKANFPSRIGFQVATKVDSRTILDTNGAESLLGKGDMLFLPPGQGTAVRMHGAFVSDADAENLVAFLKQQPAPEAIFHEDMLRSEGEGTAEIEDDLFEDALRLVIHQGQASVSYLQRRLKVGYSRAGRLMDLLESVGAVGPSEGSKPREVLADESFLQDWIESRAQGAPGGRL